MQSPQTLGYRKLPHLEGAKDAPLKEPLLLLRGLGRSSRFWLGFEEQLREHGDVLLVDLLGTGMSPSRLGRWSVADHASDVLRTLDEMGVGAIHIVSISFGAMVGIEMAGRLGERCRSIVCMATSASFTREQRINPKALFSMASTLGNRMPRNGSFAKYIVSRAYLKRNPGLPRIWDSLYETEGFSRLATIGQLVAAARFDGKEELAQVQAPSLFLVSRDDVLVGWRNSVVMAQTAPKGQLQLLEGVGHDLPTEIPGDLSRIVAAFCRDAEADPE